MPTSFLSVDQDMYDDNKYVLKDGANMARVHPTQGKGDTLAQRDVSLPHLRVRGKLVWFWWVSGSMQPQGTRVMLSVLDFNGTSGRLDMAVLDVQFTKLPGWSYAASYFFITFRTAEYLMRGGIRWSIWVSRARSDQDSIRAAGGASSLIRNAGVKKVMLSQTICAAYIQMNDV
eukprot:1154159-Pelagomonas_calceolata.AAC.2